MSIGFILFLYNLFLCDIDSIYTMFFLILLVILYGPRVCNKRLNNISSVVIPQFATIKTHIKTSM